MLEEILNNARLSGTPVPGNSDRRIIAPDWLNSEWLDKKIKEFSQYKGVSYELLKSKPKKFNPVRRNPSGELGHNPDFSVPLLRLNGINPKIQRKKVLVEAIHAYEWAAIDAIFRFIRDWCDGTIPIKITEKYDISVIPLLSIDQFPTGYGSQNHYADYRLETITNEIRRSDLIIELHEGPLKNNLKYFRGISYTPLFAIGILHDLLVKISSHQHSESMLDRTRSKFKEDMKEEDLELVYYKHKGRIDDIMPKLKDLKIHLIEFHKFDKTYTMAVANNLGIPVYGIELYSDFGEMGFLSHITRGFIKPLVDVATYINRSLRQEQINNSRIHASKNGTRVIEAILEAHL